MSYLSKVVLVSTSGYIASRDDRLLLELIASGIELFCAVGVGADVWEDALDWLCIDETGVARHFVTTTSHLNESEEEVIEFAKQFVVATRQTEVEVIRV